MYNYRNLIKVLLLFAFIYMMLCPYAEVLSSSYGSHIVIHQYDDIRKIKKLIQSDYQPFKLPVFTSAVLQKLILTDILHDQAVSCLMQQNLGLSLTSTEHLLL